MLKSRKPQKIGRLGELAESSLVEALCGEAALKVSWKVKRKPKADSLQQKQAKQYYRYCTDLFTFTRAV